MKRIIVTADDFGLCREVNEAVEAAHRDGILSAASLMVSAPAADDAVERALRMPSLRVGLHLVLVDGWPTLPPREIPDLVDADGALPNDLIRAGIRWFFSPSAARQLEREIIAQFEAFRRTGLPLDHVNAHNHMHVHPTVLAIILRLAPTFGVASMRLVHEPRAIGRIGASSPSLAERMGDALITPWMARMRRRIAQAGLRHNDVLLGLRASGHLNTDSVLALIDRLPDGVSEMYFHPATRRTSELAALMPGYDNEGEFAALTNPAVKRCLQALGVTPVGFADLAESD